MAKKAGKLRAVAARAVQSSPTLRAAAAITRRIGMAKKAAKKKSAAARKAKITRARNAARAQRTARAAKQKSVLGAMKREMSAPGARRGGRARVAGGGGGFEDVASADV